MILEKKNTSKIVEQLFLCICKIRSWEGACECIEIEGLHEIIR